MVRFLVDLPRKVRNIAYDGKWCALICLSHGEHRTRRKRIGEIGMLGGKRSPEQVGCTAMVDERVEAGPPERKADRTATQRQRARIGDNDREPSEAVRATKPRMQPLRACAWVLGPQDQVPIAVTLVDTRPSDQHAARVRPQTRVLECRTGFMAQLRLLKRQSTHLRTDVGFRAYTPPFPYAYHLGTHRDTIAVARRKRRMRRRFAEIVAWRDEPSCPYGLHMHSERNDTTVPSGFNGWRAHCTRLRTYRMIPSMDRKTFIFSGTLLTLGVLHLSTIFFGDLAWWIDLCSHFPLQIAILLLVVAIALRAYTRKARPYAFALACYGIALLAWVVWTTDLPQPREEPLAPADIYFQNVLYAQDAEAQRALAAQIARNTARVYAFVEPNPLFVAHMQRILGVTPIIHHSQGGRSCAVFVVDTTLAVTSSEVRTDADHDPLCIVRFSSFDLFVAHPLPPLDRERYVRQNAYLSTLTEEFGSSNAAGRSWLMVGDLNMTPFSVRFRNAFSDYARSARYTWRTDSPFALPIDHVLGTLPYYVESTPAYTSDHRGLAISFTTGAQDDQRSALFPGRRILVNAR